MVCSLGPSRSPAMVTLPFISFRWYRVRNPQGSNGEPDTNKYLPVCSLDFAPCPCKKTTTAFIRDMVLTLSLVLSRLTCELS